MHPSPPPVHPSTARQLAGRLRGGFLYVAVLFTTLIVMASVTAALSISTANLRSESDRAHQSAALRLAESEIHRLAALINADSSWRASSANNVFSNWSSRTVDGSQADPASQVRYRLMDRDGDLADEPFDPVQLTVHAKVGSSEAALTVEMESDPTPFDMLDHSVTATDDLQFESGGALTCERTVQVADDCKTNSWGILTTPQLQCSGMVQMALRGGQAPASVSLPSFDVLEQYIAAGTRISTIGIPRSGSDLVIQDRLLTATDNPFGALDASGIYWLDAGGSKVVISHCRLKATLAIRNASEVEISGGIVWDYPTKADVILAADSPIVFRDVEGELSEPDRNVNFNPTSSAFRGTLSNGNTNDVYLSGLRGLLYSTDDLRVGPLVQNSHLRIAGSVIARDIWIEGFVVVTSLDEILTDPPLGLRDPLPMRFVRGSLRRIPAP